MKPRQLPGSGKSVWHRNRFSFTARKNRGMSRPWRYVKRLGLQRNEEDGVVTKPSLVTGGMEAPEIR
jgi:hypothetical protein